MNSEVIDFLSQIKTGSTLYFRFHPEVLDFTDKSFEKCNLLIQTKEMSKEIVVSNDIDYINMLISLLKLTLFSKDNKVICWNIKNFISFVKYKTRKDLNLDCSLIDLKILELYLGRKNKEPDNFSNALLRLKSIVQSGEWKEVEEVYKNIFIPLITRVIPSLETTHVLNDVGMLFPYYEINGQDNGRMKCSKLYSMGYIPHTLSFEEKKIIKPRSYDEIFLSFDYKGMEVFVLANLSKDLLLLDLCKSKDVYFAIADQILDIDLEKKSRELAKKIFLPTIYGQTAYSLNKSCDISLNVAEKIQNKINLLFPSSIKFVESYQSFIKQFGYAKDVFGKKRYNFEEGKDYAGRNFSIQSPSSLICLEKLINLHFAIEGKADIAYTVHDGYVVYANKENWKDICKICYNSLITESELCSGLKLKVTCKAGTDLNNMKLLNR